MSRKNYLNREVFALYLSFRIYWRSAVCPILLTESKLHLKRKSSPLIV
nr:MAG TPA: hypothetical protein [Caudoviricetes sp.]